MTIDRPLRKLGKVKSLPALKHLPATIESPPPLKIPLTIPDIQWLVIEARRYDVLYADHSADIPYLVFTPRIIGEIITSRKLRTYFLSEEFPDRITYRGKTYITPHGAVDLYIAKALGLPPPPVNLWARVDPSFDKDIVENRIQTHCPCRAGNRAETYMDALEKAHAELAYLRLEWKPTARAEKVFEELLYYRE